MELHEYLRYWPANEPKVDTDFVNEEKNMESPSKMMPYPLISIRIMSYDVKS